MPPPVKPGVLISRELFERNRTLYELIIHSIGAWCPILIDCGAFTDFSLNRDPMPVQEFVRWLCELIERTRRRCTIEYFSLDVIGNGPATRYNYEAMLDAGLRPIPIITRGASRADIDRFLDTSNKVAFGGIGGSVGRARQDLTLRWMIAQVPRDYPVHWLGFTKHDWMLHYRPASVDSVSWEAGRMYRRAVMYRGNLGRPVGIPRLLTVRDRRALRVAGFTPEMATLGELAGCVTTDTYVRYAHDLGKLGIRYYFVLGDSAWHFVALAQRITDGACPREQYRGRGGTSGIRPYLERGVWPVPVEIPCRHR